jgi:predicted aldo/keto reductase-like oxidoreductase
MAEHNMQRREFMKGALLGGAGLGLAGSAEASRMLLAQEEAPAVAATMVPRRKLGSTGETIPIIQMGGSQTFDLKYDKLLHRALGVGINYIDTAQVYAAGNSQKGVGAFQEQVGRDKLWITTKVKLMGRAMTPENYKKQLDSCLEDLRTDHVELFFMHMIKEPENLDAQFIKMGDELKKSGKTKFFGFSCHDGNVPELLNMAAKIGGIDAILFRYNFRQYGDLELNKAIDACKAAGIGLMVMKTQSSVPDDLEKVVDFQSKNFTLGQAKLKSVWADDRIDSVCSQMSNIELIAENSAAAISPEQLTMNEFHQLNRLARMTSSHACLGCSHICESRIGGHLKIADALRYLMYSECYGDPETARMLYHALGDAERNFEGVDLTEAIKACPQGIAIDARLQRAREVLMA